MDYSLLISSVLGIFQARILEWVAISCSRRSSPSRDRTQVSRIADRFLPLNNQLVKNPSAMQQTLVQFLGWEVPLEKEMASHSSILAWKIPWTEEPSGLQSMVS